MLSSLSKLFWGLSKAMSLGDPPTSDAALLEEVRGLRKLDQESQAGLQEDLKAIGLSSDCPACAGEAVYRYCHDAACGAGEGQEHLHRECSRCGYVWIEDPVVRGDMWKP